MTRNRHGQQQPQPLKGRLKAWAVPWKLVVIEAGIGLPGHLVTLATASREPRPPQVEGDRGRGDLPEVVHLERADRGRQPGQGLERDERARGGMHIEQVQRPTDPSGTPA